MDRIKIDIRSEANQVRKIFYNQDLVSIEDLLDKIVELDDRVSDLEDEIRDINQDIEDNYKRISVAEQYDIDDKDFI